MAEEQDISQKTEEPTPRKLEEALEKGQVVSSRELTHFCVLIMFTLVILWGSANLFSYAANSLKAFIISPEQMIIGDNGIEIMKLLKQLIANFLLILAIPVLLFIGAIILSNFIQHGIIFAPKAIRFDLSKISLSKGMERLFSLKAVVELLKAIIKFTVIIFAIYFAIHSELGHLQVVHSFAIQEINLEILHILKKLLIAVCIVMGFVGLLDFFYQRYEYLKSMRMTRQEVKDEFKQTEGSPEIKAKLKSLRAARSKKRMMAAVPTADVVITNPTHYAVALKYDVDSMHAPQVVAKGKDHLALKIRTVAKENAIPIVENPPLARALFESTEIDDFIPYEHYRNVAQIISYVMKFKK